MDDAPHSPDGIDDGTRWYDPDLQRLQRALSGMVTDNVPERGAALDGKATVLFVCLHGSAKSLIAAEYLNVLARERGIPLRGESSGFEPDASVPAPVVTGLAEEGIDVRAYVPRAVTTERLASAAQIVSFGCDLSNMIPRGRPVEQWDDLPLVSDGYATARDAIVARVAMLLDRVG